MFPTMFLLCVQPPSEWMQIDSASIRHHAKYL